MSEPTHLTPEETRRTIQYFYLRGFVSGVTAGMALSLIIACLAYMVTS